MIGHKIFTELASKGLDVTGTVRHARGNYDSHNLFLDPKIIPSIDVTTLPSVEALLNSQNPDIIINCVGITLRKPEIKDEELCVKVNAEFPHFLKKYVEANKKYLIHFSTDCVFSGKAECYTEESKPDATDVYGRTKALGEVIGDHALTLRGSQFGSEVFGKSELLEWAIAQTGQSIKGYDQAIYSGVTTNAMADLVADLIQRPKRLTGLYQVASQPISKYDLLCKVNEIFKLRMKIEPDSSYKNRKVLSAAKIASEIGYRCPLWDQMLEQTYQDRIKNRELYGA